MSKMKIEHKGETVEVQTNTQFSHEYLSDLSFVELMDGEKWVWHEGPGYWLNEVGFRTASHDELWEDMKEIGVDYVE